MKGKFLKRKLNKFKKTAKEKIEKFFYEIKRYFVKKSTVKHDRKMGDARGKEECRKGDE